MDQYASVMERAGRSDSDSERDDFYREFIEYIRTDIGKERRILHRRMFSVFVWSFVVPVVASIVAIVLLRVGLLPRFLRRYLDWLIVVFPLAYGVYVLSVDFVRELPTVLRRGGMGATLGRVLEEERWRTRVCADLKQRFLTRKGTDNWPAWSWLVRNFSIDLQNMQQRTRYLTAFAGAVFFLLLQGIDFLDDTRPVLSWQPSSFLNWVESSSTSVAQFVGLGLFLVLFYLSGNQVCTSLTRYLRCAELVRMDLRPDRRREDDI